MKESGTMNTMKTTMLFCASICAAFSLRAADFVPEAHTGKAIQKAIDAAHAAGGGRVTLEKGAVYHSGTLYLKSRVELNVPEGAVISGAERPEDYDDIDDPRIGRRPEKSSKVFISCIDGEDVSITGKGVIDGRGVKFYDVNRLQWKRFYAKPPHPRPRMVQFFNCRNVKFEDVTFKDSPGWTCWIRQCENFTADRVKIVGDQKMINNDGFHMDSCRRVRIRNCELKTGDDCIIMRAIRTPGGPEAVCEDMVVENCTLDSACQCIRLGCPSDGIIRNGTFRNLKMSGFNAVASVHPVRYMVEGEHGSCLMKDILVEDCDIDAAGAAVLFSVDRGIKLREFGNVTFKNVRIRSKRPFILKGTGDTPLRGMTFENVDGTVAAENPVEMQSVENVRFDGFGIRSGAGKKTPLALNTTDTWERGLEAVPEDRFKAFTVKDVKPAVHYAATSSLEDGSKSAFAVIGLNRSGERVGESSVETVMLQAVRSALGPDAACPCVISPLLREKDGRPGDAGTKAAETKAIAAILEKLRDRMKFPNLRRVILAEFSPDGRYAGRCAVVGKEKPGDGIVLEYAAVDVSGKTGDSGEGVFRSASDKAFVDFVVGR